MKNEQDFKDWIMTKELKFRYQLLDRMRQDCEYYIRNDFKTGNCLWAGDQIRQIEVMKIIWSSFPDNDKPEWLTWEEILEFERKMC
ncbi:MAG: hypothetical protein J6B01_04420 [Ruminococcus sp.]|nr:hypothetical protein [Ruminococcus sp.]